MTYGISRGLSKTTNQEKKMGLAIIVFIIAVCCFSGFGQLLS